MAFYCYLFFGEFHRAKTFSENQALNLWRLGYAHSAHLYNFTDDYLHLACGSCGVVCAQPQSATMKVVSCHSKHNNFYIVIGIFGWGIILFILLCFSILMCVLRSRIVQRKSCSKQNVHFVPFLPEDLSSLTQKSKGCTQWEKMMKNWNTPHESVRLLCCVVCFACGTSKQFAVSILNTFFYFTRNGFIFLFSSILSGPICSLFLLLTGAPECSFYFYFTFCLE